MRGKTLLPALIVALGATIAPHVIGAGIYTWKDSEGKTHFGDRPPADAQHSSKVKIRDIPDDELRVPSDEERNARRDLLLQSFEEKREKKKREAAARKSQRQQLKRSCIAAKKNLELIERASYLFDRDASGKAVIRSDESRAQTTLKLQEAIRKHCR